MKIKFRRNQRLVVFFAYSTLSEMQHSEQQGFLLAFHRAMTLTSLRYEKIKQVFQNDWEKAFHSNLNELHDTGIDRKGIEKFLSTRDKVHPKKEWECFQRTGAKILLHGEKEYPQQLTFIYNPPPILFYKGEIKPEDFPSVSVVGARKISSYGKRVVENLVGEIAAAGITIVSGLAMGVDAEAHKMALFHGTRTIGVLGNGIDTIYPQQNKNLAARMLKKGAILSEYLPGTEIRPENFPVRNRMVAGLSKATIVVEAAEKSGSLITAKLANEQGREVFAVPGDLFSPGSAGTNQLILEGVAAPALSGKQILEHLGFKQLESQKQARLDIPESGTESDVLKLFEEGEKVHLDDLIRRSNQSQATVSSTILVLEVKGVIKNLGRQIYVRNY